MDNHAGELFPTRWEYLYERPKWRMVDLDIKGSCTDGTLAFQETDYGMWSWNSEQLDQAYKRYGRHNDLVDAGIATLNLWWIRIPEQPKITQTNVVGCSRYPTDSREYEQVQQANVDWGTVVDFIAR